MRFLYAVGDLLIGWRLLVQAEVALAALDRDASAKDLSFYRGKVVIASYFAKNILPVLASTKEILVPSTTRSWNSRKTHSDNVPCAVWVVRNSECLLRDSNVVVNRRRNLVGTIRVSAPVRPPETPVFRGQPEREMVL